MAELVWVKFHETHGNFFQNSGSLSGSADFYPKSNTINSATPAQWLITNGASRLGRVGIDHDCIGLPGQNNINGQTRHYVYSSGTVPAPAGDFSAMIWFTFTSPNASSNINACIFHKGYYGDTLAWSSPYFSIGVVLLTNSEFPSQPGILGFNITTAGAVTNNLQFYLDDKVFGSGWMHVGLTYNATTRLMRAYFNGDFLGEIVLPAGGVDYNGVNGGKWYVGAIGHNSVNAEGLNGDFADFRIHDTEWTAAQFLTEYRTRLRLP